MRAKLTATLLIVFTCYFLPVAAQQKLNNSDSLINIYEQEANALGLNDTLIHNEKTAITIAEAILFNIYGKEKIEREKPYVVDYKNGCWYIRGYMPESTINGNTITVYKGGVFSIVINAKDGKAVVFPHGK